MAQKATAPGRLLPPKEFGMSTSTASPTRTRIQGWSLAGAWVLGLIGISQLIAWGNRWYAASKIGRASCRETVYI